MFKCFVIYYFTHSTVFYKILRLKFSFNITLLICFYYYNLYAKKKQNSRPIIQNPYENNGLIQTNKQSSKIFPVRKIAMVSRDTCTDSFRVYVSSK